MQSKLNHFKSFSKTFFKIKKAEIYFAEQFFWYHFYENTCLIVNGDNIW